MLYHNKRIMCRNQLLFLFFRTVICISKKYINSMKMYGIVSHIGIIRVQCSALQTNHALILIKCKKRKIFTKITLYCKMIQQFRNWDSTFKLEESHLPLTVNFVNFLYPLFGRLREMCTQWLEPTVAYWYLEFNQGTNNAYLQTDAEYAWRKTHKYKHTSAETHSIM